MKKSTIWGLALLVLAGVAYYFFQQEDLKPIIRAFTLIIFVASAARGAYLLLFNQKE